MNLCGYEKTVLPKMSKTTRRNFLQASLAGVGLFAFQGLTRRNVFFQNRQFSDLEIEDSFYGELFPTASANTGETFLALPQGFQYNVFGQTGSPMSNGQPTPMLPDGMTVFDTGNTWTLIRNHEVIDFAGVTGAVSGTPPYDANAGGGTTTLLIDKVSRLPVSSFVSLSGTLQNCAGGVTPWKTWISCEENTNGQSSGYFKPHGYCFEVPLTAQSPLNQPVALTQMGRFKHEAVAVDHRTGIVYLTEDYNPCGFYRFVPNRYGRLAEGGRLQMLAVRGQNNYDTRTNQTVGEPLLATWVDILEPNTPLAESNVSAVFNQGFAAGGASFKRLEGCFAYADRIYFTSTSGGNAGIGQVWEYRHRKGDSGILKLIFESPSVSVLNFPDNICFGNKGDQFICEDNNAENYIRILSKHGVMSNFAKNIVANFSTFEFNGCVFSLDLRTLFCNIQRPGLTFAIWGNW